MTDWSQIVQEHGPVVWRTAYRLLGNEADAADCFQRTFVSALELSRKEAVHNWPALLRRLATARALERLRQRHRDGGRLTGVPRACADRRTPGPAQAAAAAELEEDLRKALTGLDALQAEVFCLTCLEGFPYREVADHLGVTVNHVGVLLHRAKAFLRERLRAHDPAAEAEGSQREVQP
jgi:RNA polymerase sigma-70 factor (ECF subfamily)